MLEQARPLCITYLPKYDQFRRLLYMALANDANAAARFHVHQHGHELCYPMGRAHEGACQ